MAKPQDRLQSWLGIIMIGLALSLHSYSGMKGETMTWRRSVMGYSSGDGQWVIRGPIACLGTKPVSKMFWLYHRGSRAKFGGTQHEHSTHFKTLADAKAYVESVCSGKPTYTDYLLA